MSERRTSFTEQLKKPLRKAGVAIAGVAIMSVLGACGNSTPETSEPRSAQVTAKEGTIAQDQLAATWSKLNTLATNLHAQSPDVNVLPASQSLDNPDCQETGIQANGFEPAKYTWCKDGTRKLTAVPSVTNVNGANYEVDAATLTVEPRLLAGEKGLSAHYEKKETNTGKVEIVSADTMSSPADWQNVTNALMGMSRTVTAAVCTNAAPGTAGCENA